MAEFQARLDDFEEEETALVGLSTDRRKDAAQTVEKLGLTYPVGCEVPVEPTAATLRAFYETRRGILHATGFLVRPDATIGLAVYSTSAIGRLTAEDTIRLVHYWRSKS